MFMIQVIIAAIGLLAAVITASLFYYFTKKHQLKMEERKLKEEYYKSFIKALSDVAIDNFDDEAQKRLSEGFNSLIIIASPNVVKELMDFHDFIRPQNTTIPRDSAEWLIEHDNKLRILVKTMREDIYGKEKNIDKYISQVHLVGKAPKRQKKN
jgi:hypothetical protein